MKNKRFEKIRLIEWNSSLSFIGYIFSAIFFLAHYIIIVTNWSLNQEVYNAGLWCLVVSAGLSLIAVLYAYFSAKVYYRQLKGD